LRRLALLAALVFAAAACSNSDPVKVPNNPPPVSTTTIQFSTYIGKDLADLARDVALDAAGNTYVVGGALSTDLLPGSPVRAYGGNAKEDAFVAKLDTNGQVVWWTFLGGPGPDRGFAVDIDPNGDVVIGGSAAKDFPVTPGALLTTFQGGAGDCDPSQLPTTTTTVVPASAKCDVSTTDPARDGFVAKLSGATGALVWSTYFGSGRFEANTYVQEAFCTTTGEYTTDDAIVDFNDDADPRTSVVRDVAVDPQTGEIYLTFSVRSSLAFFPDPDLVRDTANTDPAKRCNVLTDGTARASVIRNLPAVILAALQNGDQPNTPALDTALGSATDGILAKLAPDGASLPWATFIGGRGEESDVVLVKLDSQGNPVILLATASTTANTAGGNRVTQQDPVTKAVVATEPIVENAFGLSFGGVSDFYIAKYALNGPLIWATYVGGGSSEIVEGASLALLADDSVVVAGGTNSSNFFTPGAFDTTYNGGAGVDFFSADCGIAVVAPNASSLQAATYYGGASGDGCSAVAVDSRDRIYVTGGTSSLDMPIRSGPFQTTRPGARSAFLGVFDTDLATLLYSGYFGGTGLGNSWSMSLRSDAASSGRVVFVGVSEAGYPLTPAPGTPARGTVTAPPAHAVATDATLGF
jgi:hypothetical protein